MKNKTLLYVGMALMALCFSFTAMAQGNGPVRLGAQPTNIYFDSNNFLAVQPTNTPSLLMFMYRGGGFPAGTQIRMREVTTQNGVMVSIDYLIPIPEDLWTPLLWSQLKCKDEGCQTPAPKATPVPVTPEPQQCHWYYQWPCMSKGEKTVVIGVAVVGVVAGVCSIKVEGAKGPRGKGGDVSICGF